MSLSPSPGNIEYKLHSLCLWIAVHFDWCLSKFAAGTIKYRRQNEHDFAQLSVPFPVFSHACIYLFRYVSIHANQWSEQTSNLRIAGYQYNHDLPNQTQAGLSWHIAFVQTGRVSTPPMILADYIAQALFEYKEGFEALGRQLLVMGDLEYEIFRKRSE